jgi:hypothetical protein
VTKHCVHFVVLLIASAFIGTAHASTFDGSFRFVGGTPSPFSVSVPYPPLPSISINVPFEKIDYTDPFHTHPVTVSGNVTLSGVDRSFGISSNALASADPGSWQTEALTMESRGILNVSDSMRLITEDIHHVLSMEAFWYVQGDLSVTADGKYSSATPPVQADYVTATSDAKLEFTGTGALVSAGPYGGNTWGEYAKSINSNLTVDPNNFNHEPPTVIPLTFLFLNDVEEPFTFTVTATSKVYLKDFDATTLSGGLAAATVFFGHTFTWGGITSVTDADTGEPISNWTLTSASGTDWAHAVPEPSSLTYAAIALILLALGRRK